MVSQFESTGCRTPHLIFLKAGVGVGRRIEERPAVVFAKSALPQEYVKNRKMSLF